MAEFGPAIEPLLKLEGGYAPEDSGAGSVNYGMTARYLRSIGDSRHPEDLDIADAIWINRQCFWNRLACPLGAYGRVLIAGIRGG